MSVVTEDASSEGKVGRSTVCACGVPPPEPQDATVVPLLQLAGQWQPPELFHLSVTVVQPLLPPVDTESVVVLGASTMWL